MATETRAAPERAPAAPAAPPPRLAEGIELIGQFEDSGFKEPPYIARRADGQVVQLPRLLYAVAEQVDGRRGHAAIAERVSHAFKRHVQPDDVRFLVEEKLVPLGVIAHPTGAPQELRKADPLLALKFRTAVVPDRLVRALTTVFRPLFLGPVVVGVTAGLLALDGWLFFSHGISQSLRTALYQPAVLLLVFAGVVVATAFHELGHATACRYGGAKPGVMGVGIYIVWPAFYTDVTDAYRLGKWGRLRTDLGGVYFNAIFALLMAGAFAMTGYEPLLLLVLVQNFAIIQQLLPLLRLDGYYIISDLTGVPDMLSRIRPTLASLLPWREADDRVTALKPWVRFVVTGYVMTVVPIILFSFLMMLVHAPRVFATGYDSLGVRYDAVSAAFGAGQTASGVAGVLQMAALVLPALGIVLTTGRVGRRVGGAAWTWSEDEPLRRGLVVAPTLAAIGLAAFLWWPNGDYKPIQPNERGTVQAGFKELRDVGTGRPSLTLRRERELGGAPTRRSGKPQVESATARRSNALPGPTGTNATATGAQSGTTTGETSVPTDTGAAPAPAPAGTTTQAPPSGQTTTTTTTTTTTSTAAGQGTVTDGTTTSAPAAPSASTETTP